MIFRFTIKSLVLYKKVKMYSMKKLYNLEALTVYNTKNMMHKQ